MPIQSNYQIVSCVRWVLRIIVCLVVLSTGGIGHAEDPSHKPQSLHWLAIAKAEYVVVGQMDKEPVVVSKERTYTIVDLSVNVVEVIKGTLSQKSITIHLYSQHIVQQPWNKGFSKRRLFFLCTPASIESIGSSDLYMVADWDESTADAEPATLDSIRREILNQQQIGQRYNSIIVPKDKAMQGKVRELIKSINVTGKEQKTKDEIERIGRAALPAIVLYMDDSRSMHDCRLSFVNYSPQAFEAERIYGPQQVIDALAATLNQVTHEDFGFIYNGSDAAHRQLALQGWRVFAFYTFYGAAPIEKKVDR